MASQGRARDEKAWSHARKVCRLTARQVEMARALGMNPEKLPGLRPTPRQRWKLPVGVFIEERYWKRFGGRPSQSDSHQPLRGSRAPSAPRQGPPAQGPAGDATQQASDLVCYLMNLGDDLEKWLAHGSIDPDVLPQVAAELREIAAALDTGSAVPQMPEIAGPPSPAHHASSRRNEWEPDLDDELPF
jgi:hypothetical protein